MSLPKTDAVKRAVNFATKAHGTQVRKYSNEPYINHPVEVATLLHKYGAPEPVVIAALLHDVVEDTAVTPLEIQLAFGNEVADLVAEVTDVSRPEHGSRAVRKSLDRNHLAKSSFSGASIKLADLISNSKTITECDPKFARTYMAEKRELLEVLRHGNKVLLMQATDILLAYEAGNRVKVQQ